ncbi:MAG: SDR family oxidoreductase [Actinomycetota bacterium]|nr:SDR family oxidoreductase [Actinomycetota bacterium]
MDLGIAGRVALVTASSKGLGRATALALAAEGARTVICARGSDALQKAARDIESAGGEVLAIEADVTDPGTPASLVSQTVERFGGVDILVANAGGPPPTRALDVDEEGLGGAINENLMTSIRLLQSARPYMEANRWGRVCFIASSSIKQPIPALALSNTARAGLWAWAKTAAADLFGAGITLNLACPGFHATDRLLALGAPAEGTPVGDPEDFGKVVAFLCSEQAAFISGAALQVDGARTVGLL